jgi:hypothetical protein
VTPASIGIETDEYIKHVAHGTNLYAANDHQGVLAAFRAASGSSPSAITPPSGSTLS